MKLSAAVMAQATALICKYPSIILVTFVESLLSIGVAILYSLTFYAIEVANVHRAVYIYFLFSYFWTSFTLGYVLYLTIAGLAASWYFLNNTDDFPDSPVLSSLKRAVTTSFGSASLAGFLLAVVSTLEAIIKSDSRGNDGAAALVKCVALCILAIIRCIVEFATRYALIYCATFGIPFVKGCKRWVELECKRFVDILIGGCIVSTIISFYELLFTVGAALAGLGLGYAVGKNVDDVNEWGMAALVAVISALLTFAVFEMFSNPMVVMTDTLFVCFAEAPDRLKSSANDLYERLVKYYGKNLSKKLDLAKPKEEYRAVSGRQRYGY
jgi:hypothetical protein